MANNTERTLCFGFESLASARPPWRQEKSECASVCVLIFQGEETGVKHISVKIKVPPPAACDTGKVTNSWDLSLGA